jgi:mycothiol system anti-sigma-R factor
MADCNETIRELDAYLDGELTDELRGHIHTHLTDCMDCLQAFDFHAELKAVIRRKCSNDEVPPGLLAKIESCFDTDFDGDGVVGEPEQA